jgi:hypothetical protein
MSVWLAWLLLTLAALFVVLPISSSLHGNSGDWGDRLEIAVTLFVVFALMTVPFWSIVRGINHLPRNGKPLRLFPPGFCHRCGYNLTGNESGICSECGTPILASERHSTAGEVLKD